MAGPAFDAYSTRAGFTADSSWTHTPVGTPRGALVMLILTGGTEDQVAGVTYGAVAMTEVALSPLAHVAGDEDGSVHGFFLGASIPTGAQTVAVTVAGTTRSKTPVCITLTAAGDTEVEDTSTLDVDQISPISIGLTIATDCFCVGALRSGRGDPAEVTPGTGMTQIHEVDFGQSSASWIYRTTNPSTNTTLDWTTSLDIDDAGVLAVAIREAAATYVRPTILVGASQGAHRAAGW